MDSPLLSHMHQRKVPSSSIFKEPSRTHTFETASKESAITLKENNTRMERCDRNCGWTIGIICTVAFVLTVLSIFFLGIDFIWPIFPWDHKTCAEDVFKLTLSIVVPVVLWMFIILYAFGSRNIKAQEKDSVPSVSVNNYDITEPLKTRDELNQEIARHNEEIARHIKQIKLSETSEKEKQSEYDMLAQRYNGAQTIIKDLQMENQTKQRTIDDQQHTAVIIENEKQKLENEKKELETEKQKIHDKKEYYKLKYDSLQSEKQILENEKSELENKSSEYERKYYAEQAKCDQLEKQQLKYIQKIEIEQAQNSAANHESKYDEKEKEKELKSEIKELKSEIKNIRTQNNKLKDQLQQTTMGKGIESNFIKEEDFSTKKISEFRQQTHKNAHDDIVDELTEIYEDELDIDDDESDESNENDSKDDTDKVINEETSTKSRFELLMDRIGYEFLFDLLMLSHEIMSDRKTKICQIVARQLNIENNKQQKAEEIAAILFHTQLQQQWEDYLKNKMENAYGINVCEINQVIDDIFAKICADNKYKYWRFLETKFKKQIKKYIWKCCEICWIMMLTKPELTFYPSSFRMFVENKENEYLYNAKDKHDLWTGSKTKHGAKILFFAMPAIVQSHFINKDQKMHIIKGTLFAHNDDELMKYIMSDPQQLIEQQS